MARISALPAQARTPGIYRGVWLPLTSIQRTATQVLGAAIVKTGWPTTGDVARVLIETSEDGGVTVSEKLEFTADGASAAESSASFFKKHPITGAVIPFWSIDNVRRRIRITLELFTSATASVDAEMI